VGIAHRQPGTVLSLTAVIWSASVLALPASSVCSTGLFFISDFPKKIVPPFDVLFVLDPKRCPTVDNAQYRSIAGIVASDDNLDRIGRRTENIAHLRHGLDRVKDIYRKAVPHYYQEAVPGFDAHEIVGGDLCKPVIGADMSNQALAGGLGEGYAELWRRHGTDHRLVDVFDRFDEMSLTEDYIQAIGELQFDIFYLHFGSFELFWKIISTNSFPTAD
jgi:hypothetical protein